MHAAAGALLCFVHGERSSSGADYSTQAYAGGMLVAEAIHIMRVQLEAKIEAGKTAKAKAKPKRV